MCDNNTMIVIIGKAIPLQAWTSTDGSRRPIFQDIRHMKAVRLSALRTGHLYTPVNIPGTHFCYGPIRPQGHSEAGKIMSTQNSSDTIGNRTRDIPACNTVPEPTAPPRAPDNNRKNVFKNASHNPSYSVALVTQSFFPLQN